MGEFAAEPQAKHWTVSALNQPLGKEPTQQRREHS
ncbi:Uncharacterised protein [Vibrio cholerae]|nr:Uncharacterised protein [Vibrio cholerae]